MICTAVYGCIQREWFAVAAQVRRLKMYNSGRPVRDKKGKIVSQDLQSAELPSTRVVPDRRWFGNTRVVGQKQLQSFREQMAGKADSPFAVLLRQRKLPLQVRIISLCQYITHGSQCVLVKSLCGYVANSQCPTAAPGGSRGQSRR